MGDQSRETPIGFYAVEQRRQSFAVARAKEKKARVWRSREGLFPHPVEIEKHDAYAPLCGRTASTGISKVFRSSSGVRNDGSKWSVTNARPVATNPASRVPRSKVTARCRCSGAGRRPRRRASVRGAAAGAARSSKVNNACHLYRHWRSTSWVNDRVGALRWWL